MKAIQTYLTQAGISRQHKGFHYFTCLLMILKQSPHPIINIETLFKDANEQYHLNDEYNVIYQRCKYCIKNSHHTETKAKSVKQFLYDAYYELFLEQ